MTSPTRGVPVQMDRERHIRFPLAVLRDFDEDADLGTVLYLGLKHEDPDLTPEQVGEIVDLEMLPELGEPLRKASGGLIQLDKYLGALTDEEEEAGKPAARKTRTPKKRKK